MSDALTGDASRQQPVAIDLTGIETTHPDRETTEHLVSTAVAETAAGVAGVYRLGGAASRALDRASRRVLGVTIVPGVTVSRTGGVTTVDLDLVVEYPHTISVVIESVRTQVTRAATQLTDGPVEVNVNVADVHGPFDPITPPADAIDPAESLAAKTAAAAEAPVVVVVPVGTDEARP